jgi:hypothetical protein
MDGKVSRKSQSAPADGTEPAAVSDVRHRLTPDELEIANNQIRKIVEDRIRHSGIFDPGAVRRITESIVFQPTVDGVVMEGGLAGPEENRRLGLGDGASIGIDFARAVRDLRGSAAIDFVRQSFAQLQTRYRCTLLRVLGARNDAETRRLSVRLQAADRSCIDSLGSDGEVYSLRDLPLFPLPGCPSRQCPCRLELIEDGGSRSRRAGLAVYRRVRLFFVRMLRTKR